MAGFPLHRATQHYHRRPPDSHVVLNASHPLAKGLKGLWLHDVVDYSIGGIDGAYEDDASATIVEGFRCVSYDDVDDYMSVSTDTRYDIGLGDFDFSCWVHPDGMTSSTLTSYGLFIRNHVGVANWAFRFRSLQFVQWTSWIGGNTRNVQDTNITTPLENGEWQHVRVALDRSADAIRVYRNNELVSDMSISFDGVDIASNGIWKIGTGNIANTADSWKGYIRDVRIRNTLLSAPLRDLEYRSPYSLFRRPRLYLIPSAADEQDVEEQTPGAASILLAAESPAHFVGLNAQAVPATDTLVLGAEAIQHAVGLNSTAAIGADPLTLDAAAIGHAVGLNSTPPTALPLAITGFVPLFPEGVAQTVGYGALVLTGGTPSQRTLPYYTQWITRDDQASAWTKRDDDDSSTEPL